MASSTSIPSSTAIPFTLDVPTMLSLATALSLLPISILLAIRLIPSNQTRTRILFFWHAYDALTHFVMEGSYLYHCFFSYTMLSAADAATRAKPFLFDHAERLYGAAYGSEPTARMWQEYGKADARWVGADLGVIALEILTVFVGGPLAAYICYVAYRAAAASVERNNAAIAAKYTGRMWLLAIGLAVAELYGGWMTFAPEWLSGSTALETGEPMYLWLYLVFFNGLWVVVPIWILCAGSGEVNRAFVGAAVGGGKKRQ